MDDAASASYNDSDILQPQFQVTNLEYFLGPGHHDDHGGGGNISIDEEEAYTQGTASTDRSTDDDDGSTNNNPTGALRVRRGWRRLRQTSYRRQNSHRINQPTRLRPTSHRINQSTNNNARAGTTNAISSPRNTCARLVAILTVWGPIFLAIIVPAITGYLPDFGKVNVRFLFCSLFGTSLLAFVCSTRYLAIHNPIEYLKVMFAAITIYVVAPIPVVIPVFVITTLGRESITSKVFLLGMSVCGWGLLILISTGGIFKDHDYKWHRVTLFGEGHRNHDCRHELFQRGIDENTFKYKYLPKVHLICFCLVCILIGTIGGASLWPHSLAITLPLGITNMAIVICIGVNND